MKVVKQAQSIPSFLTRTHAVGKPRRAIGDPVAPLKQTTRFTHQAVGPNMRIEPFKRLACNRQKSIPINIVFGDGLASASA